MNHRRALADVTYTPFWLDSPSAPQPLPALVSDTDAELAVVGGGFSGLWTALLAKERDPRCDVVVVEQRTIGWAASGRNGGFCAASLTHGLFNGLSRWPGDMPTLERLGLANLDEIEATLTRYDIDCGWERTGELDVATEPWQVADLHDSVEPLRAHGHDVKWLDGPELREQVASPTYLAGLWDRNGVALLDPARLAWGLRAACLRLGVRIFENTEVTALERGTTGVVLGTPHGQIRAHRAALCTNAFKPLLRRIRHFVVPVYDYVLMTAPLSAEQLAAVGWQDRQGIGDSANQFHYYRLSDDNRILWGGYDAIYHFGNALRPDLDRRAATFALLAEHFFATFPQLEGLRFTHAWGGAIDTCSRFSPFWGTAVDGRVGYVAGYTGLGVGASRFGAEVLLDLLGGAPTERTELAMVRSKPVPFPPEPLRFGVIEATRRSLARADRNAGRRNLWLRTLDRFGLGFDS
ncbi:MAG TPA: FAD-dependent oxidoreductase [Jiangellaceae bacterium]|nr:FAD-dependent oxidoreductase [Jiangellaceae bacterium]